MNIQNIVVEIDAEISKLQQVRALLVGISTTEILKPGRPANASSAGKSRTRRTLSRRGAGEDRRRSKGSLGEIQEGREESGA